MRDRSLGRSTSALEVRGQPGFGDLAVGRLVPRHRVRAVVELLGKLREPERIEGVAHHGELAGLVEADGLLGEARLRPVRQARRMERDRADVDALPGTE